MPTKAILSDSQCNRANILLDITKTPADLVREAVKENPDFCSGTFQTKAARDEFVSGASQIDPTVSTFSLVRGSETIKSFDFNTPLCEQLDGVKLPEDEIPEMLVSMKMTVG